MFNRSSTVSSHLIFERISTLEKKWFNRVLLPLHELYKENIHSFFSDYLFPVTWITLCNMQNNDSCRNVFQIFQKIFYNVEWHHRTQTFSIISFTMCFVLFFFFQCLSFHLIFFLNDVFTDILPNLVFV